MIISAGKVCAGPNPYVVVELHDHKTLKLGDVVRMSESMNGDLFLIRTDYTIHSITDDYDQYVHLEDRKDKP